METTIIFGGLFERGWRGRGGGGAKVCINDPGHMTKMAATPIYGGLISTKVCTQLRDLPVIVFINQDYGFTSIYFSAMSSFVIWAFQCGYSVACDLKVGRYM